MWGHLTHRVVTCVSARRRLKVTENTRATSCYATFNYLPFTSACSLCFGLACVLLRGLILCKAECDLREIRYIWVFFFSSMLIYSMPQSIYWALIACFWAHKWACVHLALVCEHTMQKPFQKNSSAYTRTCMHMLHIQHMHAQIWISTVAQIILNLHGCDVNFLRYCRVVWLTFIGRQPEWGQLVGDAFGG